MIAKIICVVLLAAVHSGAHREIYSDNGAAQKM